MRTAGGGFGGAVTEGVVPADQAWRLLVSLPVYPNCVRAEATVEPLEGGLCRIRFVDALTAGWMRG